MCSPTEIRRCSRSAHSLVNRQSNEQSLIALILTRGELNTATVSFAADAVASCRMSLFAAIVTPSAFVGTILLERRVFTFVEADHRYSSQVSPRIIYHHETK